MATGAVGDVGAACGERVDEGWKVLEVGGEVDVHVGADVGVRGEPGGAEGEASAFDGDVEGNDFSGVGGFEFLGDGEGSVGGGVVGDDDAPGVGGLGFEEFEGLFDAGGEDVGFVVAGDD